MKYYFVLFLFTYTFSYGQVKVSDELKAKADKIRNELLNGKSLPSKIENNGYSNTEISPLKHRLFYSTTRTENNIVDSVSIFIGIIDDSLNHMQFDELHLKNGKEGKAYS